MKSMSKNTLGFIIIGIISIAGLGLGSYTFLKTQIFVEPEETFPKLVGFWDELYDNQDYAPYNTTSSWLFQLLNNTYNDSEYISINNSNTCVSLKRQGIYRIQMTVLLSDLDIDEDYWLILLKNGETFLYLTYFENPSVYPDYLYVNAEGYIMSDGNDYIQFYAKSRYGDAFFPYISAQEFNQLLIEFIL